MFDTMLETLVGCRSWRGGMPRKEETNLSTKRLLSGVRATGGLHVGNYLGAIRQWVDAQGEYDCFYFIADLHGLTDVTDGHKAAAFAENRLKTAATFLAAGLNPDLVTLFFQSEVPQHTELMWYLSAVARVGELERMTQWKDKAGLNQAGASASLFVYPVLMASDILLYDASEVPVGDDQRQHVEVTRDWAERFNSYFGKTFVVPRATVPTEAARVMDLQGPSSKMSKSSTSTRGTLFLEDAPDQLRDKVMRAITDRDSSIRRSKEKPGITNLIDIYAGLTRQSKEAVEEAFAGKTYAEFKRTIADAVVESLDPIRQGISHYMSDRAELSRVLAKGTERATDVAEATCQRVRKALGTGSFI